MSFKLLSASVNPVDLSPAPDVSTSLVPLTQRAISTRSTQPGQISLVPPADAFAWSSSTRGGGSTLIYGTPVAHSQGDETGPSGWEYLSGWAWSHSVELTAIAHYLFYAVGRAGWSGQLLDVYA